MPETSVLKPTPYLGADPYIFVSYAHKDMDEAMLIITRLQAEGYRVWYDEGIGPGTEWDETIAAYVEACGCFVALLSLDYLESTNCKDELYYARELEKPRLMIYLRDVQLPGGMRMRLGRQQAIHKHSYPDAEKFFAKLFESESIRPCCGGGQKTLAFGNYIQTSSGTEKTPIEWLILNRTGSKALQISRHALDAQPFNTMRKAVSWKNSTLRTWLNTEFLTNAFEKSEQKAIITTDVYNTKDKVFLMDINDLNRYFPDVSARMCRPTPYAVRQGAWVNEENGNCMWWIQSFGSLSDHAMRIRSTGLFGYRYVDCGKNAVRPALWVDQAADVFRKD